MEQLMKKVPLFFKLAKKDTLISDLLRSEPHPEKGTLFWEFLNMHVNTYHECGPPMSQKHLTLILGANNT